MIILGVDTTAVIGSVAVCEIENKTLKSHTVFTVKNKLTHSETLLPMIDAALKTHGVDVDLPCPLSSELILYEAI